jgi:hypothetical protein
MAVAPAELMFSHPVQTKLPDVRLATKCFPDEALCDCSRAYSDIRPIELVLMQKLKPNKLTVQFNPVPVVVTDLHNPSTLDTTMFLHFLSAKFADCHLTLLVWMELEWVNICLMHFPFRMVRNKGDALSPLLFNFA